MENLDEKIDTILTNSLQERVRALVDLDRTAARLNDLLKGDGETPDLDKKDLEYMVTNIASLHNKIAAGKARTSGKNQIQVKLVEDSEKQRYLNNQLLRNRFILPDAPDKLRAYMSPTDSAGELDYELAVYRFKKVVWAAQQMGLLDSYNIGDFSPRDPSEEEEAPPEEPAPVDLPPESVKKFMVEAAFILAARAVGLKDVNLTRGYGKLLRKYFIEKRVRRTTDGAIAEEDSPTIPSTRAADRADSELVKALTKAQEITPQEARENLKSLKRELKVDSDSLNGSVDEVLKEKGIDIAELEGEEREDLINKVKSFVFLVLRYAGLEKADAQAIAYSLEYERGLAPVLESGLQTRTLDLNKYKTDRLDEGMLSMFGAWVEYALKGMFGGWGSNLRVIGTQRDVESFARALSGEARYVQAARRHGLDHPTTYKNKTSLEVAVKNFEKETGIQWPFR